MIFYKPTNILSQAYMHGTKEINILAYFIPIFSNNTKVACFSVWEAFNCFIIYQLYGFYMVIF